MNKGSRAVAWSRWGVVAIVMMAVLAGAQARAVTAPTIGIKEFKYAPSVLTVPVGTTVTWINHDEEPHTVTSTTGGFSSPGLVNNDSFVQTFKKPGTYTYSCALHPQMRATVIVK